MTIDNLVVKISPNKKNINKAKGEVKCLGRLFDEDVITEYNEDKLSDYITRIATKDCKFEMYCNQ